MPEEWKRNLERWAKLNESRKIPVGEASAPDRREEYFLYQTLVGSWPIDGDGVPEGLVARVQAYMVKAAREAKINTSWSDPDNSYAVALSDFVAAVVEGPDSANFLREFLPFQKKIARIAVVHSLSQTLLKIAAPGVPDVYQGCELWDWSLVDPDNRRPVDYPVRTTILRRINDQLRDGIPRDQIARDLLATPGDGAIKLYVTATALRHRRDNASLYAKGEYIPLKVEGEHAAKVVGFGRRHEGQVILVVAPRLASGLMGADGTTSPVGRGCWRDTRVVVPNGWEARGWRNLFTDRRHEPSTSEGHRTLLVGDLFQDIPVGLLVGSDS